MITLSRPFPASVPVNVGSGWGVPRAGGTRAHEGLDIAAPVGTPILAAASGTVFRVQRADVGAGGLYVGLRHAGNVVTRYMHMSSVHPAMAVGRSVARGEIIGYVGNTGASEGPHLHMDVRVPPALLPRVQLEVGKPSTGWGTDQGDAGVGIPGEPWVPVDSYRQSTKDRARQLGIPLWTERSRFGLLRLALAAVVLIGGYSLTQRGIRRR